MKSLPFLLLSVALSYGFPIFPEKRTEEQNMQLAQEYLDQFYEQGNDPKQQAWKSSNSLEDKIKQMQAFFELNVTGEIDAATLQVMQQPRCGVPDIGQFVLALPGWQKTKLTYRIVNYTPDMKQADVDAAIQKACEVWSSVTPLTFRRVYQGKADITIVFTSGVHGRCPRQFDGPLGVLGHAFPPSHFLRGSVHLDEDETWSAGLVGFNLYLVATHEIGHALGLAHSADPEALMYPNYKPIDPNEFPLSQDDITGIQTIYGPSHDPSKKPTKPKEPKACDPKISFDAVTTLRGETIFIKDRHLWRVYRSSPEVDLELILAFWPFLPSGIQAAYENMKNQVLFFKDNLFWMTSDFRLQPGYPQTIDNFGFPPNVKKIDAAGFDQNTGKTFFFVGDQYWRYDENSQSMDKNYPRKVREDFPGIGKKVDAVFQRNGFFYFFHGSKQWEFDWNAKKVTRVMKSNSWFNC
ncbi:matrix metalloproteinase-27-like isoform X2 [Hemicordylus capensis]|uniref:matrix metalloproteinase-27-like isoform X2 n=1 Tax=Hemicordylus capensis TaxID=884348 RepID=UPI0023033914|nr:matrix metalloproteinase-27-like isoform X2 [Hemicordylus capensis]